MDPWLKLPALSSFAVAGFGAFNFLSTTTPLPDMMLYSQVTNAQLGATFVASVGCVGLAHLGALVGRASAHDESTNIPLLIFSACLGLAWLGNVGIYTSFLNGVIVTWQWYVFAA
jgi:hypothetical protein